MKNLGIKVNNMIHKYTLDNDNSVSFKIEENSVGEFVENKINAEEELIKRGYSTEDVKELKEFYDEQVNQSFVPGRPEIKRLRDDVVTEWEEQKKIRGKGGGSLGEYYFVANRLNQYTKFDIYNEDLIWYMFKKLNITMVILKYPYDEDYFPYDEKKLYKYCLRKRGSFASFDLVTADGKMTVSNDKFRKEYEAKNK